MSDMSSDHASPTAASPAGQHSVSTKLEAAGDKRSPHSQLVLEPGESHAPYVVIAPIVSIRPCPLGV